MINELKVEDLLNWGKSEVDVMCRECGLSRLVPIDVLPRKITILQALRLMHCTECSSDKLLLHATGTDFRLN